MRTSNKNSDFRSLFYPRNVVIFEAKRKIDFFIEGLIRQAFPRNNIYPISSEMDSFSGIKCLPSIDTLPIEEIDLLILSIRRDELVLQLKAILTRKKVKFVHIFTAGTGEFDELGLNIEREIKVILDKTDTRAIGPNCMGIYSPGGQIAYYSSFPEDKGNIGLIFQSGDLHSKMIKFSATRHNLRFSKGASIGNCVDIQVSELLNYYNNDSTIDLICVYFEGFSKLHPQEGKKLFLSMKDMTKPVLFMRGGQTARGQKAVLSHTGSLATQFHIWNAIFKQSLAIEVNPSLDDLIDYTYLFYSLINRYKKNHRNVKYPISRKALIILWSGGFGILATDSLTQLGIELPYFEGKTLEKLKAIYDTKIGSLSNPLDLPWIISKNEFFELGQAAISEEIDFVIVETDAWRDMDDEIFLKYYGNLKKLRDATESRDKIFLLILHDYPSTSRKLFYDKLTSDDFIVYPTIDAAARSFLKLVEYGSKQRRDVK